MKKAILIIVGIAAVGGIAYGIYYFRKNKNTAIVNNIPTSDQNKFAVNKNAISNQRPTLAVNTKHILAE